MRFGFAHLPRWQATDKDGEVVEAGDLLSPLTGKGTASITLDVAVAAAFSRGPTTFLPLGAQLIDNRPAWTDTGQVQFECCHCQYERRDRASALLEPLDLLGSYTDPVRQRFLKPALGPPSRAQFFDQNMNSPSIIFSTELS